MTWNDLRATRAARPGFARDSGNRANIYGAALEQAEQLFSAAERVGVATSPIMLFYGTAQLGRAIVAASPEVPNAEARVNGHGATPRGLDGRPVSLARMSVVGDGDTRSSLGSLARVLGCCDLSGGRRLDDLIARIPIGQTFLRSDTLPEDTLHPLLLDDPRAVGAGEIPWMTQGPAMVRFVVHPVPRDLAPQGVGTPLDQPLVDTSRVTAREALAGLFDQYPGLSGWRFNMNTAATVPIVRSQPDGLALALELPLDEGEHNLDVPVRIAQRFNGGLFVHPDVDGCGRPDHPLALWWAVLLVLSSLARYHPDAWVKLLDIDRHDEASAVEQLLAAAVVEVPRLALDVLRGARMIIGD